MPSRRFTVVHLPGQERSQGLMLDGNLSAEDAIAEYRSYTQKKYEMLKEVVEAHDEDLHVQQQNGSFVRRNVKVLQKGRDIST